MALSGGSDWPPVCPDLGAVKFGMNVCLVFGTFFAAYLPQFVKITRMSSHRGELLPARAIHHGGELTNFVFMAFQVCRRRTSPSWPS